MLGETGQEEENYIAYDNEDEQKKIETSLSSSQTEVAAQNNKPIEEEQKAYDIISTEHKKVYSLNFEDRIKKIRIKIGEKDIFPANFYENIFTLEDLIKINEWFKNFSEPKELLKEFNQLSFNESFNIELISKNVMRLLIKFPEESNIGTIIIELNKIRLDQREMLRQLHEKYKSIQKMHEDDFANFKERIEKIEVALGKPFEKEEEEQKKEEEEVVVEEEKVEVIEGENMENENESLDKEEQKNIEKMKNQLKKEVKNLVQKGKGKGNTKTNAKQPIGKGKEKDKVKNNNVKEKSKEKPKEIGKLKTKTKAKENEKAKGKGTVKGKNTSKSKTIKK